MRLDQRFARQKTACQLFLAHLKLEHADTRPLFVAARLVLDTRLGRVERDIERKRGLAHAGTRRNQNQVGFIQAGQRGVQRMEARGHTRDITVRLGTLVQFGIQIGNNLAEFGQAFDFAPLPDAVNALLSKLRDAGCFAAGLQRVLLDFATRIRKLAQQTLVAYNAHIFAHIACARRHIHQLK